MPNTLDSLIEPYLADRVKAGRMLRSTAKTVRYVVTGFSASFGARPLHHLTGRHVQQWVDGLDHLAPATKRGYLSRVSAFCTWLVVREHISRNPCVDVERIPQPRAVPRAISGDDLDQLLRSLPDLRARVIVMLMVGCGLRCVEVARLSAGDYDGANIRVVGKASHQRIVPVPAAVRRTLDNYLRVERVTAGPLIRNRKRRGRPLDPATISQFVGEWMTEAGIKTGARDGRGAHSLRHTAASDVFDACRDLTVVQHMLGHAHASTTSRYLRHADLSTMRAAMEARPYAA